MVYDEKKVKMLELMILHDLISSSCNPLEQILAASRVSVAVADALAYACDKLDEREESMSKDIVDRIVEKYQTKQEEE